jgi:hypothetical protein
MSKLHKQQLKLTKTLLKAESCLTSQDAQKILLKYDKQLLKLSKLLNATDVP